MTAFIVIGVIGLLLLVASLVLGEVFDGLFDAIGGDVLSTAAVAGFLAAFGFAGAIAARSAGGTVAVLVGVVAGVVVGGVAGVVTRGLSRSRTDATPTSGALVGLAGTVVTAVPSQGYGEVSVTVAGHLTKLNARAETALAVGTPVMVTATLSPTSVVVARRP
ncbi:MAG: hypothetical protein ACKVZ6_17665 [Kineosporiaceae bacterium]|jgi:hypothetical protein